jgi:hypothetical protein
MLGRPGLTGIVSPEVVTGFISLGDNRLDPHLHDPVEAERALFLP